MFFPSFIKKERLLRHGPKIIKCFPMLNSAEHEIIGGGRVVRRCWISFRCQGVLLTWLTVGQGPIVLSVGAGGDCLDIFSVVCHFSFLSPSLWETARYRLKYCLKGPLSPQQPTNQPTMKLYMLINSKLLIITSDFLLSLAAFLIFYAYEYENANIIWHFHIYQQRKFHAQLS